MELNDFSADDKLQKYMEFNDETPLGGVEYIPNKDPQVEIEPLEISEPIRLASNFKSTFSNYKRTEPVNTSVTPIIEGLTPPLSKAPLNPYYEQANNYKKSQLKSQIASVESDGMGGYKAHNPTKGSTAVGKYQFIFSLWGDSIKRVTGVKNMEEFKASPKAQEDFFDYYEKTTLQPQLKTIRKEFPDSSLTDMEIMKMLHFRGLGSKDKNDNGVRDILRNGKLNQKMEANNLTVRQYLDRSKNK